MRRVSGAPNNNGLSVRAGELNNSSGELKTRSCVGLLAGHVRWDIIACGRAQLGPFDLIISWCPGADSILYICFTPRRRFTRTVQKSTFWVLLHFLAFKQNIKKMATWRRLRWIHKINKFLSNSRHNWLIGRISNCRLFSPILTKTI